MAPSGVADSDALSKTASLTEYLADLTGSASRTPVRDITADGASAPELVLWENDFPAGVAFQDNADDVVLRLAPVKSAPAPRPPDDLADRVDPDLLESPTGAEPALLAPPDGTAESTNAELHAFGRWLAKWREWAQREAAREPLRRLYQKLEKAAKTLEQRDDEYELVLAAGLLTWRTPDGLDIRRHLLVEQLAPALDKNATVTVTRIAGKRRMEDRELLEGQSCYRPDRGREIREGIVETDAALLSERLTTELRDWLGLALDRRWAEQDQRPRDAEPPATPVLSTSPALVLRPRGNALISETYRRIAEALRDPAAPVPVGLAQLVVNTEPERRAQWLRAQGAADGDVLGTDPLFPLPANAEQSRVIELLRSETGVVVQGPPGTGKTHTIANLVSALLARGQRVLVTSQKDQALRVLREKIPPELRKLCVLLTGGSKDAAEESQQSLDALAQAMSAEDEAELARRRDALYAERNDLREQSARLNERIRDARTVELDEHRAVAPGYRDDIYRGTLAGIVRDVQDHAEKHGWMPDLPDDVPHDKPPLSPRELADLGDLLAQQADRPDRTAQQFPEPGRLPTAKHLAELVTAEAEAREEAERVINPTARELARLPLAQLRELREAGESANEVLRGYGLLGGNSPPGLEWVERAVRDLLAGQRQGLWSDLLEVRGEPVRLQEQLRRQGLQHLVQKPPITAEDLGTARRWLDTGGALLEYLRSGGSLRSFWPSKPQKEAAELLHEVLVDGRTPRNAEQLAAAIEAIEAETAAAQLVAKWAVVDVPIRTGEVHRTLSELADNSAALQSVARLGELHQRFVRVLEQARIPLGVSTLTDFAEVLAAVAAAEQQREWETARESVTELHALVRTWTDQPDSCPELRELRESIGQRDVDGYVEGLRLLDEARAEQDEQFRRARLQRTLATIHPELMRLWEQTAADPVWQRRDIPGAWAWSLAKRFVQQRRNADTERELTPQFNAIEERLGRVVEQLVAVEATLHCLRNLTDEHSRALNTYQAHVRKLGARTGKKTREFLRAARKAMEKARDAVPAWVVPLPNLLDNITADRDRFDVVIVDEASQVGIEHLYLLWMAPRVIVVGDEKQCTPGPGRNLEQSFQQSAQHLSELAEDIRHMFTPKSHLYEVLTARSGKDALVRLREHFRCAPEIISWSSREFYQDGSGDSGLIPLRQRKADDLEPLRVTLVQDAAQVGRDTRLHNRQEATEIVDTLAKCLQDPAYAGKSFGVVVLRGSAKTHLQMLERLISERIAPEDRQQRGIRVGFAPDFQGDERDVILLSMVVAQRPRLQRQVSDQQSYNVAASRARDQMWLFSSLPLSTLPPGDLRTSLQDYMQDPPPVFGHSPELDEVPEDEPATGFDSLFEQRVFREIKSRGYHVVSQYSVGSRKLDLVVAGRGGRIAVECDGHYFHHGLRNESNDAQRDRELARMKWEVIRVRESEFEFCRERELAQVWDALESHDIQPGYAESCSRETAWTPVNTGDEHDQQDEEQR